MNFFFNLNPINKITEKIYLGDIDGAKNTLFFKKEKINYIISLAGKMFSPTYDKNIITFQKIIEIEDDPNEKLPDYQHFLKEKNNGNTEKAQSAINKNNKEKKGVNEVLKKVREKRPFVGPNFGFMKQLEIYENLLKKNNYDLNKIDFNSIKWPIW